MYRVAVYSITGTGVPVIFFKAIVHGWNKRISAPGQMTFSLPIGDPDATAANLQKYRRVTLSRLRQDGSAIYDVVWTGYIEAAKENLNMIDVICQGTLNLFKKRFTADDYTFSGQGSSVAFSLLSTANSDNNTGVIAGNGIPAITFTVDVAHNSLIGGTRNVGDALLFFNTGGSLPSPLTGATYYVVGFTAYGFQVSLSLGGSPVTLTTAG